MINEEKQSSRRRFLVPVEWNTGPFPPTLEWARWKKLWKIWEINFQGIVRRPETLCPQCGSQPFYRKDQQTICQLTKTSLLIPPTPYHKKSPINTRVVHRPTKTAPFHPSDLLTNLELAGPKKKSQLCPSWIPRYTKGHPCRTTDPTPKARLEKSQETMLIPEDCCSPCWSLDQKSYLRFEPTPSFFRKPLLLYIFKKEWYHGHTGDSFSLSPLLINPPFDQTLALLNIWLITSTTRVNKGELRSVHDSMSTSTSVDSNISMSHQNPSSA